MRRNDQAGPALGEIHLQCQTLAADRAEFAARDSSDARACDAVVDRDVADFNRIVDLGRRTGSTVWGSHYYMGLSLLYGALTRRHSLAFATIGSCGEFRFTTKGQE